MRRQDDQGATAVEFALVLPIFVVLISIGTYFSWIFFQKTQLERAAGRAARYAAVQQTDGQSGYCKDLIVSKINADLAVASVDAGNVIVSDGTGAVLSTNSSTVASANGPVVQCPKPPLGLVKVQITRSFTNPFAAFIDAFVGGDDQFTVTGTGEVRVENAS